MAEITRNGLCVAVSQTMPTTTHFFSELLQLLNGHQMMSFLMQRQANVLFYYGDSRSMVDLAIWIELVERNIKRRVGKVWITITKWEITLKLDYSILNTQDIHGSLSFLIQTKTRANYEHFQTFLMAIERFSDKGFHCSDSKQGLSMKARRRCTEKEELEALPQEVRERTLSLDSNRIFNTVKDAARALNAACSTRASRLTTLGGHRMELQKIQPWQVFYYLSHIVTSLGFPCQ